MLAHQLFRTSTSVHNSSKILPQFRIAILVRKKCVYQENKKRFVSQHPRIDGTWPCNCPIAAPTSTFRTVHNASKMSTNPECTRQDQVTEFTLSTFSDLKTVRSRVARSPQIFFSDFLCVVYFSQNSSSNITVQNSCFQRNLITFGMFGWDKIQTNMKFCSRDYALISRCLISSPTVRKLSKTNRFQHFPRLVHKFPMVDAPWTSWISTNYV